MMLKVKIVNAQEHHINKIAEIEREYISSGWSLKAFEDSLKNSCCVLLTAVIEQEAAGFINASFVVDECEIQNIAVTAENRRKGIAGLLIKELEKRLPDKVENIYLEVRSANFAAIALYESVGFNRCGLRKGYYNKPTDDAVLMHKKIKGDV